MAIAPRITPQPPHQSLTPDTAASHITVVSRTEYEADVGREVGMDNQDKHCELLGSMVSCGKSVVMQSVMVFH